MARITPPSGQSPAQLAAAYMPVNVAWGGVLTGDGNDPSIGPLQVTNAMLAGSIDRGQLEAVEAWQTVNVFGGAAPAFTSGWATHATFLVKYRLDEATGLVRLRGLANFSADPGANSIMFALPSGYRPAQRTFLPVWTISGGTGAVQLLQINEEASDGSVFVSANLGANAFVYLDTVSFSVT